MERIPTQHLGAVLCATMRQVVIRMLGKPDFFLLEKLRCRCLTDMVCHGLPTYTAGSRISARMASMALSTSGVNTVPQALMFSSSCAWLVTPMMVLATCHLV